MWLLLKEQTDEVEIKHAGNGRDYRLPELPTSVWTVIVQRPIKHTSSLNVSGKAITVSSSVT